MFRITGGRQFFLGYVTENFEQLLREAGLLDKIDFSTEGIKIRTWWDDLSEFIRKLLVLDNGSLYMNALSLTDIELFVDEDIDKKIQDKIGDDNLEPKNNESKCFCCFFVSGAKRAIKVNSFPAFLDSIYI